VLTYQHISKGCGRCALKLSLIWIFFICL